MLCLPEAAKFRREHTPDNEASILTAIYGPALVAQPEKMHSLPSHKASIGPA